MSHSSGNDVISAANVRSRVTVLGWKSKRRVDLDEESFNSVLCGLNHLLLLQMEMPSWRCVVDRKCVPDRMSLALHLLACGLSTVRRGTFLMWGNAILRGSGHHLLSSLSQHSMIVMVRQYGNNLPGCCACEIETV